MKMPNVGLPALLFLLFVAQAAPGQGAATTEIHNCPTSPITHERDCVIGLFTFDRAAGLDGRVPEAAHYTVLNSFGAGVSLGNAGGWRVQHGNLDYLNVSTRGITQDRTLFLSKHAVGDTMGTYDYVFSDGGTTAMSDESIKGEAVDMGETTGYFHGMISATTGVGDTKPELTFLSGNNWTTDGAPLLDISQGRISGHITGPSVPLAGSGYLNSFPVDNELPVTTGWGVCDEAIPYNKLVQTNTSFTCNVRLKQGRFAAAGLVCVTGPNYPEQAPITAASEPVGGRQTITIAVRNPNEKGANILQGGLCGQFVSFDANLAVTGYRSSYYAFGALDAHHLIYGMNIHGQVAGGILPMHGGEAEQFGVVGFDGYHLFPGCEVIANRTLGASPMCEPNSVPWSVADQIEAPHNVAVNVVGRFTDVTQNTPANGSLSAGDMVEFHGAGTSGPAFIARRTRNGNPSTMYKTFGGALGAPDMHRIEGYFENGMVFNEAPATVVRVYDSIDHVKRPITLFALPGGDIKWDPATATLQVPNLAAGGGGGSRASGLRGTTGSIGGSPLGLGSCATGRATVAGATSAMVPVTVAANAGAPGFSPGGAFQVNAQVTSPNIVTVSVCAVIAGTPQVSSYIVVVE